MKNDTEKILRFVDLGKQPSYRAIWELQKKLQRQRIDQQIPDTLLFVEHQPVYTIGKNGTENHVIASAAKLEEDGIEVVHVDRGGDVTYHGPGQLVGYPILDLRDHQKSISWYMRKLEEVFVDVLAHYGLQGTTEEGLTGVWVKNEKLLALGVRIARWVTMHGFAFNVQPQLGHFDGIIPCGIFHKGVTSLQKELGREVELNEVGKIVLQSFQKIFTFSHITPASWLRDEGNITIVDKAFAETATAVSNG